MSGEYDRKELEKQIYEKNITELRNTDGINRLLAFNLENFAYRYFETSEERKISCQVEANDLFVEYIQDDVVSALKTRNKELKAKLIELCKLHPGQESKNIKVRYRIGTTLDCATSVSCYARVDWDFPDFRDGGKSLTRKKVFSFDDPMILRNKHAAILEEVCEVLE